MPVFDVISLSSVKLITKRVYEDGGLGGTASSSAFWWRHGGTPYIVTNWHCLTGRNPQTDQPLGSFLPNRLEYSFKYRINDPDIDGVTIFSGSRELHFPEEGGQLWYEHRRGRSVDVVVLPVETRLTEAAEICCINDADFQTTYAPKIGDDCYIVGHPEGFSGALESPIWKRGSVASLPGLDFEGSPVFLIDTVGNRGLSGSPVIVRKSGVYDPTPGPALSLQGIVGEWENFIGIYAGRMSDSGIGSQLGRIWKAEVIQEIIENQIGSSG